MRNVPHKIFRFPHFTLTPRRTVTLLTEYGSLLLNIVQNQLRMYILKNSSKYETYVAYVTDYSVCWTECTSTVQASAP